MTFHRSTKRQRRTSRRSITSRSPAPIATFESLEPRTLLTAELSLVASGTGVTTHTENGLTIVEVPAGSTFQVAASISQSTSDNIEVFQLDLTNSDLGAGKLAFSNWVPNAAWSGQTYLGQSLDDGSISDGIVRDSVADPGLGTVALGSFSVTVPNSAGEWNLKTDKPGQFAFPTVSGTALIAELSVSFGFPPNVDFDLITVTDPGNLVIRVLPSTLPTISVSDATADEGDTAAVTTVQFDGTVRDFIGTGTTAVNQNGAAEQPNFENLDALNYRIAHPGTVIEGAVSSTLGGDNNPIFASSTNFFSTAPTFAQWYSDVAGVNTSKAQTIDLAYDGQNYVFTGLGNEAGKFYPIDNQLYGNTQGANLFGDPIPADHNWHFTYEAHSTFVYEPGQTFTATADDDFWLYIDNQRVIDRGGVNIGITRTVNLDNLGLEPGSEHDIHLFYAERHTLSAIMQLSTNIPIGVSLANRPAFAEFTVSLSAASAVTTYVNFATANGTAAAGTDFVSTTGRLTFAPGVTSQKVRVPLIGDAVADGDKTFALNISAPTNATLGDSSGVGTITDDESAALPTVTVTASDSNAAETIEGQTANPGEFTFSRTGSTTSALTVHFSLGGGTATNGTDHESIELTIVIPAGQSSVTLPVTPTNDQLDESDETVEVTLSADAAYTIGGANDAVVTIADNDPELPVVTVSLGLDSNESGTNGNFDITRTGSTASNLFIHYTLSGTAIEGTDYNDLPNGTAVIPAGSAGGVINFTMINDDIDESDETVIVTLTIDNAYVIGGSGTATATIFDDDSPVVTPTVTVTTSDPSASEKRGNETADPGEFTFTRSGGSNAQPLSVHFTIDGNAANQSDYQELEIEVVIPAGENSVTLPVNVINDQTDEGNETVVITLSENNDYTIGGENQATVTIADNDPEPVDLPTVTVVANDGSAAEAGSATGQFTFTRTNAVGDLVVHFNLAGSATPGLDYEPNSNGVTIPNGQLSATVTITPVDDAFAEGTEQVGLSITPNAAYVIGGTGSAIVSILDNEGTPGTIAGSVFNDTNQNGKFSFLTEDSYNNVTLALFRDSNGNQQFDQGDEQVATTTTVSLEPDFPGVFGYAFTGLAPGNYFVRVTDTNNVVSTLLPESPNGLMRKVVANAIAVADLGFVDKPELSIDFGESPVFPDPILPGDKVNLSGFVTNSGGAVAKNASVRINAYLLPAAQLQPTDADVPVGTAKLGGSGLKAGASTKWKATAVVPDNLPASTYHFVVKVDDDDTAGNGVVQELNEGNNASSGTAVSLVLGLGEVPLRPKLVKSVKVNGITYSYSGPGSVTITPGVGGGPASLVVLTDDSGKASLSAKAGKNAVAEVQDITVTGSIKTIGFKGIKLNGNISVSGVLSSLTLGDVADNHVIGVNGIDGSGKASLTFAAANVNNLTLNAPNLPIKSITVNNWDDTDATRDQIAAPSIGTITSKDDFDADVTVAGVGLKAALKTVTVKNVMTSTIRSDGNIGAVNAGRIVSSRIFAGMNLLLNALPTVAGDFLAGSTSTIGSVTAKGIKDDPGASFVASFIAAPTVGNVSLKDVAIDNGDVKFGVAADTAIGKLTRTGKPNVLKLTALGDNFVDDDFVLRIV